MNPALGRGSFGVHSLRSLVDRLPTYFIEKRKQACDPGSLGAACEALLEKYPKAFVHPVSDGVKLYMSGTLECPWIHLSRQSRPSRRCLGICGNYRFPKF